MAAAQKPLGKKAATQPLKPERRGGPRANAGRPPSDAKKRSTAVADRIAKGVLLAEEEGPLPDGATPLDVMVLAMRLAYKKGGAIAAQPYARDAAPYIHARIAQMELKNPSGQAFTVAFRWQGEE